MPKGALAVAKSVFGLKVMLLVPLIFLNSDTVFAARLVTAISAFPSPSKSAIADLRGSPAVSRAASSLNLNSADVSAFAKTGLKTALEIAVRLVGNTVTVTGP